MHTLHCQMALLMSRSLLGLLNSTEYLIQLYEIGGQAITKLKVTYHIISV